MALTLTIKVKPKSGKQAFELTAAGIIRAWLKSPAEHNKANVELIKLLEKHLKLTPGSVRISRGFTQPTKVIVIEASLTLKDLHARLGLTTQLSLL